MKKQNNYRPYIIVASRTFFLILAQSIVSLVFYLKGSTSPWRESAAWYTVYGTIADIGCLSLLIPFCIKERLSFKQLIRFKNNRFLKDILTGVVLFVLFFPLIGMGGSFLVGKIMNINIEVMQYKGILTERILPHWAYLYSFFIWLPIWSLVEEITYQGFGLSHILEDSGKKWLAISYVGFWFTLQHSFFPLILDWRYIIFRFIAFAPLVLVFLIFFIKKQRLVPVIVAQYIMDFMVVWWTIKI